MAVHKHSHPKLSNSRHFPTSTAYVAFFKVLILPLALFGHKQAGGHITQTHTMRLCACYNWYHLRGVLQ